MSEHTNDNEHKIALAKARLEGIQVGLDIAHRAFALQKRTRQKQVKRNTLPNHDWIDHILGISLLDYLTNIK